MLLVIIAFLSVFYCRLAWNSRGSLFLRSSEVHCSENVQSRHTISSRRSCSWKNKTHNAGKAYNSVISHTPVLPPVSALISYNMPTAHNFLSLFLKPTLTLALPISIIACMQLDIGFFLNGLALNTTKTYAICFSTLGRRPAQNALSMYFLATA